MLTSTYKRQMEIVLGANPAGIEYISYILARPHPSTGSL